MRTCARMHGCTAADAQGGAVMSARSNTAVAGVRVEAGEEAIESMRKGGGCCRNEYLNCFKWRQ